MCWWFCRPWCSCPWYSHLNWGAKKPMINDVDRSRIERGWYLLAPSSTWICTIHFLKNQQQPYDTMPVRMLYNAVACCTYAMPTMATNTNSFRHVFARSAGLWPMLRCWLMGKSATLMDQPDPKAMHGHALRFLVKWRYLDHFRPFLTLTSMKWLRIIWCSKPLNLIAFAGSRVVSAWDAESLQNCPGKGHGR